MNARCRNNACVPLFILATEDIGFKRRAEAIEIANIAKMLNANKDNIANPNGQIDICIGLESANLWLREVHYVAGIPVQKSFFTKDIMLGNSVLRVNQQDGDKRKLWRNEVWREQQYLLQ